MTRVYHNYIQSLLLYSDIIIDELVFVEHMKSFNTVLDFTDD